jgi:hypothetical protein
MMARARFIDPLINRLKGIAAGIDGVAHDNLNRFLFLIPVRLKSPGQKTIMKRAELRLKLCYRNSAHKDFFDACLKGKGELYGTERH